MKGFGRRPLQDGRAWSAAGEARFRCSTEGPTEFDVLFETIIDDQFGYDPYGSSVFIILGLFQIFRLSGMCRS